MKKCIIITIIIIFALIGIYNNLLVLSPTIAVKLGQNINKVDKEGNTALMNNIKKLQKNNVLLTSDKRIKNIKTLIELGADVNIKNNDGETALRYLQEKCIEEMFSIGKCADNITQLMNLLIESKTGSDDKNIQQIKKIRDLISKQQFTTAAKLSTELELPIRIIMGNQIIENLIEKNKIIEAKQIVDKYYLWPAIFSDLLSSKIANYEILNIKELIKPLLNENKFIEARRKIENSSLSEMRKIYLIVEIDVQEASFLQPKIQELLNKNNFIEAKKLIKRSSLSLGPKDDMIFKINSEEKGKIKNIINSLLNENKFSEARKNVSNSSLPKDDKNELIKDITSREISNLKPTIQALLNENKFAKARKEIRNSVLSKYAKNELMHDVNHKEKLEKDNEYYRQEQECLEWLAIIKQQKIYPTISKSEFYAIADKYSKNECQIKVDIYDMRMAGQERERRKNLGW